MKLCVATMMKNEADSLVEWLCYHLAVGVDSFLVANNESSDATEEILKLFSEFCNLEYFNFETPSASRPQIPAFNYMLEKYRGRSDLMAFIDADEFLYPTNGDDNLKSFLGNIFSKGCVGAVGINWCNYGSSGAVFKESGLSIERFTKHSEKNFMANHHYKSIFKPEYASKFANPHHIQTSKKYLNTRGEILINHSNLGLGLSQDVAWDNVRINHYVIKSLQEYFVGKALRGNASTQKAVDRKSYFQAYDRNIIDSVVDNKILQNTYSKIIDFMLFVQEKHNDLPVYLHEILSYITNNSFFHVDVMKDNKIGCWAINKLGSSYTLTAVNKDGSKLEMKPNMKRPDVVKAIIKSSDGVDDLCGFSYSVNLKAIKYFEISNGVVRHEISVGEALS